MSTATVYDVTPAQLRRTTSAGAAAAAAVQPGRGLFADMADGAIVAQLFLNFAGFAWDEAKFYALIAGLCGEGGRPVEMFDDELAERARCTDRTIRAWRAAYLARAGTTRCALLVVDEGSYNSDRQRYERTRYTIPPRVAELIERAVGAARALPEYERNRLGALERAAGECYDEIPDAPPLQRRRKPKKSHRSPVMQSLNNAAKNLEKGRKALDAMPERMRAALLAGQGEELREMLLATRGRIDGFLADLSENAESVEVNNMPENFSGIPPEDFEHAEDVDRFRVKEDLNTTRKRSDEPEHPPEAISAWGGVVERLSKPQVQSVEVELVDDSPPEESPPSDDVPSEAQVHALVAELVRGKLIGAEEALEIKSKAYDLEVRRDFARRHMRPQIE